ncbi:hypothetical protein AAFC00_004345 [Neodothiora populina]|uniref:DNA-directed RNA polymerase III subunit RPC9 n=1 Tax=Neodothiora populina TaxID=2781224 RepID=A0ABR3PJE6_9PEZI
MQVLDAGTQVLDDFDVLKFIREKQLQHKEEDAAAKTDGRRNNRPSNYAKALKKHEEHLLHPDRPFVNNPAYDSSSLYLTKLIQTLSPHVSLTKTEYLVLANMRPYRRKQLAAMIEDVDARFTLEQQNFIRDAVVEILGIKEGAEENVDRGVVEVLGV